MKGSIVCFKCNEPGHISTNCPDIGSKNKYTKPDKPKYHGSSLEPKGGGNTCFNCGQAGHFANACKKPKQGTGSHSNNAGFRSPYCYNCKTAGHASKDCPQLTGADSNQTFARSNSVANPSNCYKCEKPGHFAASCPLNNKPNAPYKGKKNQKSC